MSSALLRTSFPNLRYCIGDRSIMNNKHFIHHYHKYCHHNSARQKERSSTKYTSVTILRNQIQNHLSSEFRTIHSCVPLMAKKKKERNDEDDTLDVDDVLKRSKHPKRRTDRYLSAEKKNKKSALPQVEVWIGITIKELAKQCKRPLDDVFEALLEIPSVSSRSLNEKSRIEDNKILNIMAAKLGVKLFYTSNTNDSNIQEEVVNRDAVPRPDPSPQLLIPRPPVVTIMGHIDHGKTSLLDYLRKSRIVQGEHGGITQHIGAFTVKLESGDAVTFIDTPGHAAFTNMRARGANITDIVILIIDACEGVLDQTLESLRMIRQARAPFIVAVNKIDKKGADVDMVKQQLKDEGVILEEDGGDVQCVPISALKGTNINKLIEEVLALSEILELQCDKTGLVEGVIIESQVEKGLGKTATILVQRGSLKPEQYIIGDKSWCKVRLLLDDRATRLKSVLPSQAAKVVGWRDQVPAAGTEVLGVESEARAKEVIQWRRKKESQDIAELQVDSIEEKRILDRKTYKTFRRIKMELGVNRPRYNDDWNPRQKEAESESDQPKVSVVIKGDVDGSVEALLNCLETYTCPEVDLDIVSFGVGEVSDTDIIMAEKFGAVVYAFNTTVSPSIMKSAASLNIPVRSFNVIYHLIGDLKNEISDHMPDIEVEDIVGRGEVLQEFVITLDRKKVPVAGTKVKSGKISRNTQIKVTRNGKIIHDGTLTMLKHHKDEVDEVRSGQECGLMVDDDQIKFLPGDEILCYNIRLVRNKTSWDPGF